MSPDPIELGQEALIQPPRDDGGMESRLPPRRGPEESRAARGPGPLVEVGNVPVHTQRWDIESDRAGRVTAIMAKNGDPVEFGQPLFVVE